jgi:hypothetical protein
MENLLVTYGAFPLTSVPPDCCVTGSSLFEGWG